jgi:uncharacterized protein YbjQ (UPF0145 family)
MQPFMASKNLLLTLVLSALVGGCGTAPPAVSIRDLSAEQVSAINDVPIYNQSKILRRKFDILKTVDGFSCKSSIWSYSATKSDAIFQTRYGAHQLGADGIIDLRCDRPSNPGTVYSCSDLVICSGEAIKFK